MSVTEELTDRIYSRISNGIVYALVFIILGIFIGYLISKNTSNSDIQKCEKKLLDVEQGEKELYRKYLECTITHQ